MHHQRRQFGKQATGLFLLPFLLTLHAPARAQVPDLGIGASLHGKLVLPADNVWNQDISQLPVDPNSVTLLTSIGLATGLHPNFGAPINGIPNGIPYIVVPATQARVPVTFQFWNESDPGPYPIPANSPIEGGPNDTGDRHSLIIDRDNWKLYELYSAYPAPDFLSWTAGSGALFNLNSNGLRPQGWTSADAAGLPIFPGLVRYDEVSEQHAINHALRFTVQRTRRGFVFPARHYASANTSSSLPPMGMRVRLKASFNVAGFPGTVQIILNAMKKYGMIVADNGSNWYVTGAPDNRWNDAALHTLNQVHGSDFEVIKMGLVTSDQLTVPSNLSAVGGNGSVNLTWSPTANAATYTVSSARNPGGPYTVVKSGIAGASTVDSGLLPGTTYYYVVTGVSGDHQSFESAEASATTAVTDFSIAAAPASQTVVQGASAAYAVTTTAIGGFVGTASLACAGLPAGSAAAFAPTTITGSGSSNLTVTTGAATVPGTYPLTISATSGSLVHQAGVTLVVTAAAAPDFSLAANPISQTVVQGSAGGYNVTVTGSGGFAGAVGFAAAGLPAGATAAFAPLSVVGSGTAVLTITTGAATPVGTYPITLTGTSGALSHQLVITLVVTAKVNGITLVSITIDKTQVQGYTWPTATVTLSATPSGPVVVHMTSSDPAHAVVSDLTLWSASKGLQIPTYPVTQSTLITITASLNGVVKTATFTIVP